MKKTALKIISIVSRLPIIYKLSKKIIDYSRNENNCDINTNGELDFIKKNRESFSVIFDVGANVGEWTYLVSKTIPKSNIFSFEPSKETFRILSSKNFSKDVVLNNIGLGDKNETISFYNNDDSTLNSIYSRDNLSLHNKQIEKVNFETLDSFCHKNNIERISFLKIDTEGGELSVLRGANQYIKNGKIDSIQFEYGGTYINANILLKDIFNFFKDKPYDIYKMMQNGLKPCHKYNEEFENFQYSNYVAILKK